MGRGWSMRGAAPIWTGPRGRGPSPYSVWESAVLRGPAPAKSDVFAANRARGSIALGVGARGSVTRRLHVREAGSLRVRFPNCDVRELEAVILNTAGGVAGGDQLTIEITVAEAAGLTVTSAAAEKIYRSRGPEATISRRLTVGAGFVLGCLPQTLILFD